ncbi:MAG: ABC transporter ATP-binding protein [Eubacteriales bacterium]|nr:ABC transporter ATP-binding protein [Eubacteriales bacterium]
MALLKVDELTMKFGGVTALDHISLQVEKNTIHGIIGPNGSGKTTLFNCISGIYKPTSGNIQFDGKDITGMAPHMVTRQGISRTFQLLRIFPSLTVLDNLILAQNIHDKSNLADAMLSSPRSRSEQKRMKEKAFEVLKTIGLEKKAYNSAEGISIGQRRMLQLGIGVINKPRMLLLDECAAGLDPLNVDKLIELVTLFKEKENITVLMIEHIMDVVMNVCEELTVLDYGERIFVGKPEDAQNDAKVIEAYLGTQD